MNKCNNRDVLRFHLVYLCLKQQPGTCITTPTPGMGTENARMWAACLLVFGWVLIGSETARAAMLEAQTWQRWEHGLKSTREYGNPYADVTLRVTYVGPGGRTLRAYGFWDGGDTFRIRCAFPVPGVWQWETACSDAANPGLHHQRGTVRVSRYRGDGLLYQRGFLKVSENRRYLVLGMAPRSSGTETPRGPCRKKPAWKNGRPTLPTAQPSTSRLSRWDRHRSGPVSATARARSRSLTKTCAQWNPAYWQAFERKVQRANESGLSCCWSG